MHHAEMTPMRAPIRFTDDELRSDNALARFGLRMTRARIEAALAEPCGECGAEAGRPCFGSPLSRVRGYCARRWARAQGTVTAAEIPMHAPGELSEYTDAERMAALHARLRDRARERNGIQAGGR